MRKTTNGLHNDYRRLYRALKRMGHSAEKAIYILLTAKRGDRHALTWCKLARSHAWGR